MSTFRETLNSIWTRLKNPGSIAAIIGAVGIILNEFGIEFDSMKINNIMNGTCMILVTLGILNDSTSEGAYIPFVNDKLIDDENKILEEDFSGKC